MSVQVKGSAITARLRWVRELYGEAGFKALKAAVTPESRALLDGKIMPHEWVPFELLVDVCAELDRLYGKGDLELCRELGRYAARTNLPTLYRIFYALGSPSFIMSRATRVWDVHYSSGELESVDLPPADGARGARLTIRHFQTPHRAHCLSVLGWAEQSVLLSGASLVGAEETQCRTRGAAACVFEIRWR